MIKKVNNKGQTLVEYVLIIALVAMIAIGAVKVFGAKLKDAITKMGCEISGQKYVETGKAGEAYCEGDASDLLGQ